MDKKSAGQKPDKTGDTREERLKQALKANLARRKAQAKAKAKAKARNANAGEQDKDKG